MPTQRELQNIRLTFLITKTTKAQLEALKEASGVTYSEMLRRMVAAAFKETK